MFVVTVAALAARPILFLHLHKSGGHFMCSLAQRNGLAVNAEFNCNVQPDQRCCGGNSATAHIAFANKTTFEFVANEGYMYDAMTPRWFTYVVVLRDAWARYLSHYNHVSRVYRRHRYNARSFSAWLSGQPDNWIVRHICGTRCMNRPKYALTKGDYLYARRRLAAFAFVARLERPAEMNQLLQNLSWSVNVTGNRFSGGAYTRFPRTRSMIHMTSLDDCLYANNHTNTCTAPYFALGEPNWTLPCGSACSKYR